MPCYLLEWEQNISQKYELTNVFLFQGKAEEQPEEPVKSPEPESEESDLGVEDR